jgi:hypothetical protein
MGPEDSLDEYVLLSSESEDAQLWSSEFYC